MHYLLCSERFSSEDSTFFSQPKPKLDSCSIRYPYSLFQLSIRRNVMKKHSRLEKTERDLGRLCLHHPSLCSTFARVRYIFARPDQLKAGNNTPWDYYQITFFNDFLIIFNNFSQMADAKWFSDVASSRIWWRWPGAFLVQAGKVSSGKNARFFYQSIRK